MTRPDTTQGTTTKIKTSLSDGTDLTFYVTVNCVDDRPVEVFVNVKDASYWEHLTAVCVMISRLLQSGVSADTIAHDLKQIHSPHTSHIAKGKGMVPSIYARIGMVLETAGETS